MGRVKKLRKTLTKLCWHSGMLSALQPVACSFHLRRGKNGSFALPFLTKRRWPNFQILFYHRLTRVIDPFYSALPVTVFENQIRYLARQFQLVDLGELLRKLVNGSPIPKDAVSITFDDGYRDNFELAFPVLQRYSAPATIFLTTGFVNREDVLWNDKVCYALKHTRAQNVLLRLETEHFFSLKTVEQRLKAVGEILWFLRQIEHLDKLKIMDELFSQLKITDFGQLWESRLTWEQVRIMNREGISFGAHTVSHPILSRVSLQEARQEILESKNTIERELANPPDLFAYPVGRSQDYNGAVKDAVREAGFLGAVTAVFGNNTLETDRWELRRMGTDERDLPTFAAKQWWYKMAL